MSESLGYSFEPAPRRNDIKEDVLDATKEGLAAILKRYSLDPVLTQNTARAVIAAIDGYQRPLKGRVDEMGSLRTLAIDTVAEALAEGGMNTPEILTSFEDTLNDYLPG